MTLTELKNSTYLTVDTSEPIHRAFRESRDQGHAVFVRFTEVDGKLRNMLCLPQTEVARHDLFVVLDLELMEPRCVKWDRVKKLVANGQLIVRRD